MIQTPVFKLTTIITLTLSKQTESEEVGAIPFDAIVPLINELRKDEENACSEALDRLDCLLSEKEAYLRWRLTRCHEPSLYQEIERELANVLEERNKISEQLDEPYEPWME